MEIDIPPASRTKLIELARATLEDFVCDIEASESAVDDPYLVTQRYGAFVSLHRGKELRGCIGTCFPTAALHETVKEMTEAAASRDRRVAAIAPSELGQIRIEISVLSPLFKTDDPLALEIGRHGLYISNGGRRGVLLPQVATQYGWDMKKFLQQTCVKAGLPKDAWQRPETEVRAFTTLIIEEGS
ncbi:MAG TPA: AmmeMemoRadiSam system protein A [Candidatus Binatia bacterium]